MISLNETVENALKSDAVLKSLVDARIYRIRPPGTPVYPYITYFEVDNTETESADDEEYADDIEIQIDIWSQGSFTAISKVVQRIMRGLGFTHQAMPDIYEDELKIFHKPIRFTTVKEVS